MFVMVMATVSLLVGMLAVYIDGQCSDVTMPGWLRVVVRKFAQLYRLPGANEAPVRSVHASAVELTVSEAKPPQGIASEINDVLCELRFITNRLKSKDKDDEKQSQLFDQLLEAFQHDSQMTASISVRLQTCCCNTFAIRCMYVFVCHAKHVRE